MNLDRANFDYARFATEVAVKKAEKVFDPKKVYPGS